MSVNFRGTVYDVWVLPDIQLLHFRYSLGSFLSYFNLMTKLFYNKQYQLYQKEEEDCSLLTRFIWGKVGKDTRPAWINAECVLEGRFPMSQRSTCSTQLESLASHFFKWKS